MKVWLNGTLVEADEARISPLDRGFLLGDGVFETLRSYGFRLPTLWDHLGRLEAGGRVVGLWVPAWKDLAVAVRSLLSGTDLDDARVRITVTRGVDEPTALITAAPLLPWPETARVVIAPWPHDEHSPLAAVKTTSRADSLLALEHARREGADEALFLNTSGNLCEATTANVFVVRDGRVETPPLSAGCLAGITREHVLRLCGELGIEAVETDLPLELLDQVDEMFLTSSTREIQSVASLNAQFLGSGPLVPHLQEQLRLKLESLPSA